MLRVLYFPCDRIAGSRMALNLCSSAYECLSRFYTELSSSSASWGLVCGHRRSSCRTCYAHCCSLFICSREWSSVCLPAPHGHSAFETLCLTCCSASRSEAIALSSRIGRTSSLDSASAIYLAIPGLASNLINLLYLPDVWNLLLASLSTWCC
jgi:hypothetical protein